MRVCAFNEIIYTSLCAALLLSHSPSSLSGVAPVYFHYSGYAISDRFCSRTDCIGFLYFFFLLIPTPVDSTTADRLRGAVCCCCASVSVVVVVLLLLLPLPSSHRRRPMMPMPSSSRWKAIAPEITPLTQCTPHVLTVFAKTPLAPPDRRHWIPIHIYI